MDPYQNPPGMPGPGAVVPPAQQVSGPAILLMVTAGMGVLLMLLSLGSSSLMHSLLAMGGQSQEMRDLAASVEASKTSTGNIIQLVIVLVASGVMFYGAMKMKNLQSFGLSMAAAIIAMVPCVQPCYCIGIPAGIWALIVLNKPEVKAAFRP